MTDRHTTARDRAPTGTQPGSDGPTDGPGISISDAAKRLGLSTDAVRSRLHRGTLPGVKVDERWQVFLDAPTVERPGTDRDATVSDRVPDGDATAPLIAHMREEIRYLRDLVTERDRALEERSRELAAERERSDILQQLALSRIPAVSAGTDQVDVEADRAPEPAEAFTVPGEINLQWARLTDALIAELRMDPEAALIAAAAELGIPYGE